MAASRNKRTVRKNFRLPADLVKWVERYAKDRRQTVTAVVRDVLDNLRAASGRSVDDW